MLTRTSSGSMKVIEMRNLIRKDVPIYYRRFYSGSVVLELMNKIMVDIALSFQIEHKPTGQVEILITSMEEVDYPLVPLKQELKRFIGNLDSTGKLPE